MNKEQAITRINTIGKVGGYIALFAKILLIIGLVIGILGGTVLFAIPNDTFKFTISGKANLNVSLADVNMKELKEVADKTVDTTSISVNGNKYVSENVEIDEDNEVIKIDLTSNDIVITPKRVSAVVWSAVLHLLVTLITFIFVEKLCKSLKSCTSPFDEGVIKGIQNCAWALIPWAFVNTISDSIMESAFTNNFNISLGVNLNVLLIILLMFGLAYIFKYGAILQTESDETL